MQVRHSFESLVTRGIELHLPRGHTFRVRRGAGWSLCFGVRGERGYPARSLRSLRTVDSSCVFEFPQQDEIIGLKDRSTLHRFVGLLRQWLDTQKLVCSHTDTL